MTDLLTLNEVKTDWITLTSFSESLHNYWEAYLSERVGNMYAGGEQKWQNYNGYIVAVAGGSMFVGRGVQKRKAHYAVWVSGEVADILRPVAFASLRHGHIRCTRLDLQATIRKPKDWSQMKFLARMDENFVTSLSQSKHKRAGRLYTVYVGSRDSDRYVRCYDKVDANNERLLRFEVEYKRERANAVACAIEAGRGRMMDYWRYELESKKDSLLNIAFAEIATEANPLTEKLKVTSGMDKKKVWLLETALKGLRRYLWQHNSDPVVAEKFKEILDEYYDTPKVD